MNVTGKRLFLMFGILLHVHNTSNDFTDNYVANDIIRRIKHTPRIRLVTICSKKPEHLSLISVNFIRKIAAELPVLVINTTELLSAPTDDRLRGVKSWLHLRSQRKSLYVLFVERNNEDENVMQLLIGHIKFLELFSLKTMRPQVICFLLNFSASLNFHNFFKYTWSLKYLDIVVIELITNKRGKTMDPHSKGNSTVFIHQYNPFNDTYYKESLFDIRTKKLFQRKLKNFYGYTLNIGLTEGIPMVMIDRNYTGNDVLNAAQGLDVMITRTLIEKLNFKVNITVIFTSTNPKLKQYNVSNGRIDIALKDEVIDFAVNFYGILGSKNLEDLNYESSIFLYPYASNLIIKQYGKPVLKISRNPIIVAIAMAMTFISFILGRWLLRLNLQVWNYYKILQAILGNSMRMHFQTVYERIFYLSLAAVSFLFSVNLLEQLLGIYLWQDTFRELRSLQDVVDADIIPSITRQSKKLIFSQNHTALKKVMERSSTISNQAIANCIELLINNNSINGCEVIIRSLILSLQVNSVIGQLVSRSFSNKEREWIITFVEEPIVQACWTSMLVSKTSPYLVQFNYMLRQFFEAGFIFYWTDKTLANFTFNYKNFFGEEELHHIDSDFNRSKLNINKTSLIQSLTFFLTMGHVISCFVFICEFIFKHLWRRV